MIPLDGIKSNVAANCLICNLNPLPHPLGVREEHYMLSKCLNSRCSATFQYFGQGQLFRFDFADAGRKRPRKSKGVTDASIHSRAHPIEHFWLCENCAKTMTVELSDAGEVRLVSLDAPKPTAVTEPVVRLSRKAHAS